MTASTPTDTPVNVTRSGDSVTATVPADASVTAAVRLRSGSLVVTAEAGRDGVGVSVTGADDRAAALLDRVAVESAAGWVWVRLPEGDRPGRTPAYEVRLRVPAGAGLHAELASAELTTVGPVGAVEVATASGDVRVAECAGGSLTTASGDVGVGTATGPLRLGSGSGDLSVRTARDRVELTSASGDLTVGTAGGSVSAESASGDVSLGEAGGEVRARTASGDLSVAVARGPVARLTTVSGDASVGVPDGTAVWLDVTTLTGDVASELSTPNGGPGGDAGGPDGPVLELTVSTVSGDVAIARV